MKRLTENKIILIVRTTRLEELIVRFNTLEQARFYIEHLGADFSDYEAEHRQYKEALRNTEMQLRELGRVQTLDRVFLTNFVFGPEDTVVVLGQDGLVANSLKYVDERPVVAVNPDPRRWDGVLLPFRVNDVSRIVLEVFAGQRTVRDITMARVRLNDGQTLYGVNDLFIGHRSHISARYELALGTKHERQSSSGIIVSTGLGSTGWFTSVLAGARGIGTALGRPFETDILKNFPWESDYLYFTVREPFPSKTSEASLVFGRVTKREPLTLLSQMPENGVIFSDGVEADRLEFNSGSQAVVDVADKKGHLVI
jgi:NAD kinase